MIFPEVNIGRQSLSEMIGRPKFGSAAFDIGTDATLTEAEGNKTLISITGTGNVYHIFLLANAATSSNDVRWSVLIDGEEMLPASTPLLFNSYGFSASSWWVQLPAYGADALCVVQLTPPAGLTFESSLEIKVENNDVGNDQSVSAIVISTAV